MTYQLKDKETNNIFIIQINEIFIQKSLISSQNFIQISWKILRIINGFETVAQI